MKVIAEFSPTLWECPLPMGFHQRKAQGKKIHEPNLHRSWGIKVGGKLCLLMGVRTLPLLRRGRNIHLVNHLEKICVYVKGMLYIHQFLSEKLREYYAYSSSMGTKLCLLVGVRTLPYWRASIRTLPFICFMIYIGLVHDKFCLMLYDRSSLWVGDITKMRGQTWLSFIPAPLF